MAAVSFFVLARASVVSMRAALRMASASFCRFLISPELSRTPMSLDRMASSRESMTFATGLNQMLSRATMRSKNCTAMIGSVKLKSKILPLGSFSISSAKAGNTMSALNAINVACFINAFCEAPSFTLRIACFTLPSSSDSDAIPARTSRAFLATRSAAALFPKAPTLTSCWLLKPVDLSLAGTTAIAAAELAMAAIAAITSQPIEYAESLR
uniref:Uncharacterized protein n=1 Tax=Physcomitrium patens TaxID=3218 RepID=A0A2K1KGS7_PHYPA|nr:hypothetical protein PHYPA_009362 [Physcomitrium patens]